MRAIFRPAQLLTIADQLRTSFWFLPSALAAAAIIAAAGLIQLDRTLSAQSIQELAWLYEFGPEGARAILAAVASSMITVAGLTFSITMLTLQLAASQYGPRILRNFMRDRGNQIVLGTFIATFVYCLMVLRTVRGTEGSAFVPHVSVAFGVLMALASLAVLIYFIHHVASSIRIETLLAQLTNEARATLDRLYPEQIGIASDCLDDQKALSVLTARFDSDFSSVNCTQSGYIQRIDDQTLMKAATQADVILRLHFRPGEFVRPGEALIDAHPRARISSSTESTFRTAIVIGPERTPDQDLDFAIRRIVEIAQRALSPGVNDPTTAIYCLDRLYEILAELVQRHIPGPVRYDDARTPRVITDSVSVVDVTRRTLSAIAQYATSDADVLHSLRTVAERVMQLSPPRVAKVLARFRDELVDQRCTNAWHN